MKLVEPIVGGARTLPDAIVATLQREILSGAYAPGDALPPERSLAATLGTNRNTLREAVRRLEQLGLVRARQGQGVTVLDFRRDGRLDLLAAFVAEPGVPASDRFGVLRDAMALRTLVLVEVATQAAIRRSPADVGVILEIVDETVDDDDHDAFFQRDLAFYRAVIDAADSQLGVWAFNTFAVLLIDMIRSQPSLWVTPPNHAAGLRRIADAIVSQDGAAARQALIEHLEATDNAVVHQVIARGETL